ncbi:MAG: DUF4012 domain-containing protein, partial [Marmoricola sp.]
MERLHRRRLRRPSHRWWIWSGGVAFLVILALAYLTWTGLKAKSELMAAKKDATAVRTAVKAGDNDAAQSALKRFSRHAAKAHDDTSGPLWKVSSWVPYVGTTPKALRLAAEAADDIGQQAQQTLSDTGGKQLLARLAPHDGAIDLGALQRVQGSVGRLAGLVERDAAELGDINTGHLLWSARRPYRDFYSQLVQLRGDIATANRAVQVMPTALGAERPQNYLVMFANNAEIRSWGGIPGSWALVRASHGKLSIIRQGSSRDFGPYTQPVTPLSATEQAIFGPHPALFFQDTGITPDFPRTAAFATAMWKTRYDEHLDGVFETDTVTLKYLLGAIGPVKVPGVALTEHNAVDELLNRTYLRIPDPDQQDVFFAAVARQIFTKVTHGTKSPLDLVDVFAKSVREGRTHLNLADPALQKQIDGSTIAGHLSFDPNGSPELGLYVNDVTASKMSYYLSTNLHTTSVSCRGGTQTLRSTATFSE